MFFVIGHYGETLLCLKLPKCFSCGVWPWISPSYGLFTFSSLEASQNGGASITKNPITLTVLHALFHQLGPHSASSSSLDTTDSVFHNHNDTLYKGIHTITIYDLLPVLCKHFGDISLFHILTKTPSIHWLVHHASHTGGGGLTLL